jgi:hypothetical protein
MAALPACASAAEALALFDALEPVDTAFLHGEWQGAGFASGHPLDGALEAFGWRGKRFDSDEAVHPLLFGPPRRPFALRPRAVLPFLPLVLRFPVLRSPPLAAPARIGLRLLATHRPRARLRMLLHRGRVSAAMVYDDVPIQDLFRRVDDDTVLGLMDLRGMERPFFFLLRRVR